MIVLAPQVEQLLQGPVEGVVVGYREGPVEGGLVGFIEGPVE